MKPGITDSKRQKVKVTLVQTLRLCTGRTAHRGSRGIALPFHDHGTRRGWGFSVTPQPLFTPGKDPVPIVQEAGWAPGPVWTGAENLAPPPPGFDPRTVQSAASCYTDFATQPTTDSKGQSYYRVYIFFRDVWWSNNGFKSSNWNPFCIRAGRKLETRGVHAVPGRSWNSEESNGGSGCTRESQVKVMAEYG